MQIPEPTSISSMLSNLYGYDVTVSGNAQIGDVKKAVKVVYNGDDGNAKVLFLSDMNFANKAGAALTLIPPGMAEENIKANKLPEDILENFREVVNVLAGLLNKDHAAHLVLGKIYAPDAEVPESLQTVLGTAGKAKGFNIKLRNYGDGQIAFLEIA